MKGKTKDLIKNSHMRFLAIQLLGLSSLAGVTIAGLYQMQDHGRLVWIMSVIFCYFGLVLYCVHQYLASFYQEIDDLSSYLQRLEDLDYGVDIRDNREGSLSILKNDIYKLITRLQNTSSLAEQEQIYLNNALAEMSHQLKTPLTALQVISDLLREDLPLEKREEFLVSMDRQLSRLSWIIQSLLKFSKFDAKTIILAKNEIYMQELLNNVQQQLEIILELREQKIIIEGEDDVSFNGDYKWISEALINIVKNCSEHSPAESDIRIKYLKTPQYTQIQIVDHGSGIAPQDLPHIFKRFYRGQNAGPDSVGIGLAMAKTIIEHQSGYITVKSVVDVGSEFDIKFYS